MPQPERGYEETQSIPVSHRDSFFNNNFRSVNGALATILKRVEAQNAIIDKQLADMQKAISDNNKRIEHYVSQIDAIIEKLSQKIDSRFIDQHAKLTELLREDTKMSSYVSDATSSASDAEFLYTTPVKEVIKNIQLSVSADTKDAGTDSDGSSSFVVLSDDSAPKKPRGRPARSKITKKAG